MNEYQAVAVLSALLALLAGCGCLADQASPAYSTLALVVSAAGPIVSLALYLLLTSLMLKPPATAALAGGGAALGMLAATRARVARVDGGQSAWAGRPGCRCRRPWPWRRSRSVPRRLAGGDDHRHRGSRAAAGFGVGAALTLMLRRAFVKRAPARFGRNLEGRLARARRSLSICSRSPGSAMAAAEARPASSQRAASAYRPRRRTPGPGLHEPRPGPSPRDLPPVRPLPQLHAAASVPHGRLAPPRTA